MSFNIGYTSEILIKMHIKDILKITSYINYSNDKNI